MEWSLRFLIWVPCSIVLAVRNKLLMKDARYAT
jgi:hypothetical protein